MAADTRLFTDGQLETLKWIAMASMFVDHVGRHLLGWGQETWVFAVGRLAFPLFAIVLGLNLAREGDRAGRSARTARRLALWCAVAVIPSVWARGEPWLVNVLGTLALGAALCWTVVSDRSAVLRLGVCLAAAAASLRVEFGPVGVFLVTATFLVASRRSAGLAVMALLMLLATAQQNASFGGLPALAGTLACLPLMLALRQLPVSVPRWPLAFYGVYPLHLLVIGALKPLQPA